MTGFFTVCLVIGVLSAVTGADQCGPNARLEPCGSLCEAKCSNPDIRQCKINPAGCRQECRCQRPYLRNEQTRRCVLQAQCPR